MFLMSYAGNAPHKKSHLLKKSLMENFIFCAVMDCLDVYINKFNGLTKYITEDHMGQSIQEWTK